MGCRPLPGTESGGLSIPSAVRLLYLCDAMPPPSGHRPFPTEMRRLLGRGEDNGTCRQTPRSNREPPYFRRRPRRLLAAGHVPFHHPAGRPRTSRRRWRGRRDTGSPRPRRGGGRQQSSLLSGPPSGVWRQGSWRGQIYENSHRSQLKRTMPAGLELACPTESPPSSRQHPLGTLSRGMQQR